MRSTRSFAPTRPRRPSSRRAARQYGIRAIVVATVAWVVLATAACEGAKPDAKRFGRFQPREEAVLHYNNFEEPEWLDPTLLTGHPDAFVALQLFEALVELDPQTLQPRPGVATHWEVDDSGTRWTFHLRKDAMWSDGKPVVAQDFVSTWERALRPATAARYAYQLYPIQNARRYNTGRIAKVVGKNIRPRRPPYVQQGPMRAGVTFANLATFAPTAHVELVTSNLRRPAGDDAVVLRASADDDAPIVGALDPGQVGVVLSTRPLGEPPRPGARRPRDFVQVRPPDGDTPGWTREENLAAAFPSLNQRRIEGLRQFDDQAPIYERPDPGAPRVGFADDDDEAYLLDVGDEFSRVLHLVSGKTGYVASDLLDNVAGDRHWFYVRVLSSESKSVETEEADDDSELLFEEDEGEATKPASVRPRPTVAPKHAAEGWLPARVLAADASVLGAEAKDAHTLVLNLEQPTPYLLSLTAFAAWRPVPIRAIDAHGTAWTRPDNIVTNGPFHLDKHLPRDRMELERSKTFHGAKDVHLDRAILYAVTDAHTSLNLYRAGYLDAVASNKVPVEILPYVEQTVDYKSGPYLATYFIRVNTDRAPLDDKRVRQALNLAIDKRALCEKLLRGGRLPATHVVPPGVPGYAVVEGPTQDIEKAKRLLSEAGYPGGKGLKAIDFLFNTSEQHRLIGEFLQAQWKDHLGVDVTLSNQEWKTYLGRLHRQDYALARSGWIGDYLDPNTFLDIFVTGGGNNETGYDNPVYDGLIEEAAKTIDSQKRLDILAKAEAILVEDLPVIPIYFYVNDFLVAPEVEGLTPNLLDIHPLRDVKVKTNGAEGGR